MTNTDMGNGIDWRRTLLTNFAPDGVTGEQLEKLEDILTEHTHGRVNDKWTPQERAFLCEVQSARMMLSCLIYGNDYAHSTYRADDILELSECGISDEEATREIDLLWKIESEFFKDSAQVRHGTFTDDEGCSYNSVQYDWTPEVFTGFDLGKPV